MNWFRFYHNVVHDPKAQQLTPALFKHWVNLLCIASENAERGILPSPSDIAFTLRIKPCEADKILSQLQEKGLLDCREDGALYPHNWSNRQRRSDDVATRVQRHRDAGQSQSSRSFDASRERKGQNVTLQVTGEKRRVDTDTDTETETPLAPPGKTQPQVEYENTLAAELEDFEDFDPTPAPASAPSRNEIPAQGAVSVAGLIAAVPQSALTQRHQVSPATQRSQKSTAGDRQSVVDAFLVEYPWCREELIRRGETAHSSPLGLQVSVIRGWLNEPSTIPSKPAPLLSGLAAQAERAKRPSPTPEECSRTGAMPHDHTGARVAVTGNRTYSPVGGWNCVDGNFYPLGWRPGQPAQPIVPPQKRQGSVSGALSEVMSEFAEAHAEQAEAMAS